MPGAFAGVLSLWQDSSERILCSRKGLSWMPVDGRDAGHAGQLWRETPTHTCLFRGAVSRTKTTSASGAGMLSLRDRSQNVIVTFGKFIEEGTLDRSHFCIQMHKTHAEWGVGDSMQRCDAVDIE